MAVKNIEATDTGDSNQDDATMLGGAFRGRDASPGGLDDLRRIVLNQRDQLIGAEAELGTARREMARLERELEATRLALHRARFLPFGWVRSLGRVARAVRRRLSQLA